MKKEEFNKVITNLKGIINSCAEIRDRIDKAGGIEDLTIKEFNRIILDAKSLQIKIDKILNSELYHLIGMGDFNAIQTQVFCKGIRELGNYRYLIKCLSFKDIIVYTDNSKSSKYKCEVLGITLQNSDKK